MVGGPSDLEEVIRPAKKEAARVLKFEARMVLGKSYKVQLKLQLVTKQLDTLCQLSDPAALALWPPLFAPLGLLLGALRCFFRLS